MSAAKARSKVQAFSLPRQNRHNQVRTENIHMEGRPRHGVDGNFQRRQRHKGNHAREKQIREERRKYDGRFTKHKSKPRKSARTVDQRLYRNKNENITEEDGERKSRKVYRKKKVFRKWVLLALFCVPLGMIWVEYYIGKLIDLEDIRDVYQVHLVDPWDLLEQDFNASRVRERGKIPSLPHIAYAPRKQCPPGQRRMLNVHNPLSFSDGSVGRLIPMIVHQQSKTRCLTMKVDRATTQWAMKRWSYFMHDEVSKSRLFATYCGGDMPTCEFPLLTQIIDKCFYNQTNSLNQYRYYSLKTELWKFLTLWIFGGIYADIDFLPHKFSRLTIDPYDDGFLLIDSDTGMLSTKWMAISPRHPIMYYAVEQTLLSILMEGSLPSPLKKTSSTDQKATAEYEDRISGSSILNAAFRIFLEEEKLEGRSNQVSPGLHHGAMNRTVRLVVTGGLNTKNQTDGREGRDNLVISIFKSEDAKEAEFQKMGMTAEDSKAWEGDLVPTKSADKSSKVLEEEQQGGDNVGGGRVVTTPRPLSCRQKLYHF